MLSQKIRISILRETNTSKIIPGACLFDPIQRLHLLYSLDQQRQPSIEVALFRQRKNRVVERRATDLGDGDGGGLLLAKREGHGGGRVGGGRAGEEGKGSELHRGYY
jgi:hypothetical protein